MRYLLIAFMVFSLSACATLPNENDMKKEISRISVNLELAPEINRRLYMAEVYGKDQYNENVMKINNAKEQVKTIQNLLDVGQLETAADKIEKVSEVLHSLNPS